MRYVMKERLVELLAFFFEYSGNDTDPILNKCLNAFSGNERIRVNCANDDVRDSAFYDCRRAGRRLSV